MDMAQITQLIGSLGFPIACCIYLFWHNQKVEDAHKEEMAKMTEALNNNTIALTTLSERLNSRD